MDKTANPESASFVSYIENNLNYKLERDDYSADFTINPKEGATDLSLKNSSVDGITIHVTSDGVSSSWKSSNILYKGYPTEYRCLYESTSTTSCTITISIRLAATADYYASSPYNNPFSISPALKDPSEETCAHSVVDKKFVNSATADVCYYYEVTCEDCGLRLPNENHEHDSNSYAVEENDDELVKTCYDCSYYYREVKYLPVRLSLSSDIKKTITDNKIEYTFTLNFLRTETHIAKISKIKIEVDKNFDGGMAFAQLYDSSNREIIVKNSKDDQFTPKYSLRKNGSSLNLLIIYEYKGNYLIQGDSSSAFIELDSNFKKEINMIKPAISFNSVNKTIENDVNKYDIEINYTESFDVDGQANTGSMTDWSIEVDPDNISTTYQDVLTGVPEFSLDRTYYTDSDNNKFYIKYKARVDQNSLYIDFIGELDGGNQTDITSVLLDEDFIKTTTKPEKIEFDPDLTETVVNESSYKVSVRIDNSGIGATISFTIQKDSINKGYIEALDDFDDPITFKGLPVYTSLRQEANKIYLDLATFNGTEYSEASTILLEEVKNEPENPTDCDCSGNYKVLLETRPATINQPAQYQFIVADGVDYITESLKEGLSKYVDELGNYKRKQITLVDSLDVNLNTFIGSEEPSIDEAVEVVFDLNQNGFEFFRGCGEAYVEDYRFISWNDTLLDQVLSEIENRFGGTMIVGKYYSIGQIAMTSLTALDPSASIDWESIPSIKLPEGLCRLYNVKTGKSNYISKEIEIKVHLIEK